MEKDKVTFIKQLYAKKDSMHNFAHILRIKKKVRRLRKPYNLINEDLLDFLINFHGLHHILLTRQLTDLGFSREYILALQRHTRKPKTIEEKLVSDANLLEAVGRFGIKKCLQVGKERGRTRQQSIDYMREHLPKIKFYTKLGKIQGRKGIKLIKEFLKNE
jgi:HD superfamily phosphodiesterase